MREHLRVGGTFRGIIPPNNSSETKNTGGMYPISSCSFEEFGGIFVTNKTFHHLFQIGFGIMAEEKKEIDERILLVVLLPIMLLQKKKLNFEPFGRIEYDLPLLCDLKVDEIENRSYHCATM